MRASVLVALALSVAMAGCMIRPTLDPAAECPRPMPATPFELHMLPLPQEFLGQSTQRQAGPTGTIHWATVADVRDATLPVYLRVSTGRSEVVRAADERVGMDENSSDLQRDFIRPPGAFVVLEHYGLSGDSQMEVSWSLLVNSTVRPGDLTFARCLPGPVASVTMGEPKEGSAAEPGMGARVWYAGFLEDGTLFGTNIQTVHDSDWKRIEWYEAGPPEPIPVYVYDKDRAEQPAQWKDPFRGTAAAGSPADEAIDFGYYTTIKGFNEALKGLANTTTRVVRIAPEDAYTLPGNEDHPLYGKALVFLVRVHAVDTQPCPPTVAGTPGRCA